MYKIVAIDLDGTLFDDKKNISKENKIALAKAKELGVKIVIATGRPLKGVMPVLEELGLTTKEDYVIIYNGAKVFNVGTKEMVFTSSINGKDVRELYQESLRLKVHFHAFRINEELITKDKNPYTDVEATINHIEDHIFDFTKIKDEDLFLKAMMVDNDFNVSRCMEEIHPIYKERYSMVRSASIFLEFLNPSTDKGKALKALADYLHIPMEETMAIGDQGNDLPMILAAGMGVSMGNAQEYIKKQADFITLDNESSGVGYAISKFILEEKISTD